MSQARNYTFNISAGVMPSWLAFEILARLPDVSAQAHAVCAQTADTVGYAGAFALVAAGGSLLLPDGPNWPVIPEPQMKPLLYSAGASLLLSTALMLGNAYQVYKAPEAPPAESVATAAAPNPALQRAP